MADRKIQFQSDLIKQIGLGINIARTYPKGHPSLKPVVLRLKILLKEIPIEEESISLVVIEDVIVIGEDRFQSKTLPIVTSLVHRFNQLGVKSITFSADTSESDIKEFFEAMAASPADVKDYGDIVALIKAKGILGITVNKFRVGVISSDEETATMNWEQFLDSLTDRQTMTEEQRVQELGKFLAGIGVAGSEPTEVQTTKIVAGLERLALMIADQYGEQRWDEYSIVFSRMLAALSPTIKKNVLRYRTENKKLAGLFRNLIPTLTDEDIIDVISAKAKERSPDIENEVVDILKNVTGSRLPGLLSTLRVNVPELNFEKIASRLMGEMKVTRGEKEADAFLGKNLEIQMRAVFPHLREDSPEERMKAVDSLEEFSARIFEAEKYELLKLLVDRLDTMADAETEISIFKKVLDLIKSMYVRAQNLKKDDIVQFISRKFSKHLLRKDAALLERKKIIMRTIKDIKDQNYVPELISLLWDPGTFADARDALAALAEFSTPLLLDTLRDTEDRSVRMKIIDVLIRIGHTAIPEIENLLSAREWYVRRNGVHILGEMEVASSLDKIGALISDDEEQVQLAVIESLSKIGGEKIKPHIAKGLNSQYKRVVLAAMQNLDKETARKRLGDVLQLLKSRRGIPDEKHERMRTDAAAVVGLLGDDVAVDQLVEIVNERAFFKGKLLEPTKKAALMALAQIGTPKAIQALHDASTHRDRFVSGTAQDILRKVESST
ncbi:hypothetical protein AMJ87_06185 [candidate division WOR_3 bacterium SM23_60]|uniref:HEAT repeat domain-containing protein n=1 Tax=candidate division WOR_3 bacterium SM23_60 TaxID=1703780 RepID=A0A0S8GFW9_UNCW3|nr:MAG: hypothetical protein AMJ87_06185 [candidate division WOR_3 bacterium SM23_60]